MYYEIYNFYITLQYFIYFFFTHFGKIIVMLSQWQENDAVTSFFLTFFALIVNL